MFEDYKQLLESFFIMLILIVVAVLLSMSVGVSVDQSIDALIGAGIFNVGGAWASAVDTTSNVHSMKVWLHVLIYGMIIGGVAQFIIVAAMKLRYDIYEDTYNEE